MAKNKWKIKSGDVKGGALGSKLDGCEIDENDAGTAYYFMNGNDTLATYTGTPPLPTAFSFPNTFTFSGPTWTIAVTSLDNKEAKGSWTASTDQIEGSGDESGEFTAQASSGADDDLPESATYTTA